MTREEARNILKNKSCVDCMDRCTYPLENQEGYCEYADAIRMAIEALKAQLSNTDTTFGKWILCSERPPKDNEVVLVTYGDGYRGLVMYMNEYSKDITAWMPAPEPYKGK